jgi:predicted RNA-binding Zn ribbon-like protein
MQRKPPRYDLPNAAPEPLRQIQRYVNTIDLSHDREWLTAWLEEQGLATPTDTDLARARALREAIRELLYANNDPGETPPTPALQALAAAADGARLTIDFDPPALSASGEGLDGILGAIATVSYTAMVDGTWRRLKCCRNSDCRWAFYDNSKNRSATWCSMQLCGNRTKIRTYRSRTAKPAHPAVGAHEAAPDRRAARPI